MFFAFLGQCQGGADIAGAVLNDGGAVAAVPHLVGQGAVHALGLAGGAHAMSRLVQAQGVSQGGIEVEHHVDVVQGELAALFGHAGLLGQDVEVEAQAVPGQELEGLRWFFGVRQGGELVDQGLCLLTGQAWLYLPVRRSVVPGPGPLVAGSVGGGAGDAQGRVERQSRFSGKGLAVSMSKAR